MGNLTEKDIAMKSAPSLHCGMGVNNATPSPAAASHTDDPAFTSACLENALAKIRTLIPGASLPDGLRAFLQEHGNSNRRTRDFMTLAPDCWLEMTEELRDIVEDAKLEPPDTDAGDTVLIARDEDGRLVLDESALVFGTQANDGKWDAHYISLRRDAATDVSSTSDDNYAFFVIYTDTRQWPHTVRIQHHASWEALRNHCFA